MKITFYISAFLLLLGCTVLVREKAENAQPLSHTTLQLDEEFITQGGMIVAFDDGIVGVEESGSLLPFFFIGQDGVTCGHFGNRGQGPEDFIRPYPIQYIREGVLGVYDLMFKSFREIEVHKNDFNAQVLNTVTLSVPSLTVVKTFNNQFVGLAVDKRFLVLMDADGEEIGSFFEYPYQNENERKNDNQFRALAYQGMLVANPQKTKCVYASFDGEIIHFYDIKEDEIVLIDKIEKSYPQYKPVKTETYSAAQNDAHNITGYISLAATDTYVYALFNGDTYQKSKKENGTAFAAKLLRVFDWSGKLVKTYQLDVLCRFVCPNPDDSRVWAIALLPEATPVYFELNGKTASMLSKATGNEYVNPNVGSGIAQPTAAASANSSPVAHPINIGKIKVGETKKFTMGLNERIKGVSTSSRDIILKDSVTQSNTSALIVDLTKKNAGTFSDTVSITLNNSQIKQFIFTGEAEK